ncbi:MAG: CapA family protein [Abitibacteriaceae bacterium]|nr:CapA family protein [Abditibacteriaceae bacterium]MBV9866956.1 CapA family protein [Abditibacteriaceae bacterium]
MALTRQVGRPESSEPVQHLTSARANLTPGTLSLDAVGDILLDRGVAAQIQQYGMGYPFQQTRSLLSAADIAFGNLECPLATHGVKVHKKFCFKPDPATVKCLTGAGMDVLSLANNHSMDCGRIGLDETMATLRANGLHWCGAGENLAGAEQPTVLNIKGVKVAFVGFCQFLPEGSFLRDDAPTIAFASEEAVRRAVSVARQQADVVIASFHWGEEYYSLPHENQVQLAHAAVAAGADLVLGHHPHVFQALEVVKHQVGGHPRRALIAYSLGNFVFDAPRAWDSHTAETFILHCTLNRNGLVAAQAWPIYIGKCCPRPATGAQAQAILARLTELSRARHTMLRAGQVSLTSKLPEIRQ